MRRALLRDANLRLQIKKRHATANGFGGASQKVLRVRIMHVYATNDDCADCAQAKQNLASDRRHAIRWIDVHNGTSQLPENDKNLALRRQKNNKTS